MNPDHPGADHQTRGALVIGGGPAGSTVFPLPPANLPLLERPSVAGASRRDTLLASRCKPGQRNRNHNSAAVYGHVANARRNEGEAALARTP